MTKKLGIPKMRKTSKAAPDVLETVPEVSTTPFDRQEDQESVIAPDDAKRILSHLFWNMRDVTANRLESYCRLMTDGYWVPGFTITLAVFEGREYLLDGQHRMLALINYGKPLRFNVKRYFCSTKQQVETVYQVTDQGKSRTKLDTMVSAGAGKNLEIGRQKLSRATSAVSTIYRKFGRVATRLEGEAWHFANNPLMQSHILEEGWGDAIRGYFESIQGAYPEMSRRQGNLNRSITIAIGLLTFRADAAKAFKFWKGIGRFQSLEENDPRVTAARYLMSTDMKREGGIPRHHHAKAILSCWNAFAQNRSLTVIRVQKQPLKVFGFDYEL